MLVNDNVDFKFGSNNTCSITELYSLIDSCEKCGCCVGKTVDGIIPFGNIKSKFVLIHQNIMEEDSVETGHFNSKTDYGIFFDSVLTSLGLNREDIYISTAQLCPPVDKKYPKFDDLVTCRQYKYLEFSLLTNIRCVFLMGECAFKQFFLEPILRLSNVLEDVFIYGRADNIDVFVVPIPHITYMMNSSPTIPENFFENIKNKIVLPIKENKI